METVSELGLHLRAAVHTGEIEILDSDVAGIGRHITSRVLDEASDDQIVVTRTVRELATVQICDSNRSARLASKAYLASGAAQSVDRLSDSSIGWDGSDLRPGILWGKQCLASRTRSSR